MKSLVDLRRADSPREELDGWLALAKDAEAELNDAVGRVRKLKEAIRIFRGNADRGEFYPSVSSKAPSDNDL